MKDILKSELYEEFLFALKFVNRERVAYPIYFEHLTLLVDETQTVSRPFELPVGRIGSDMGPTVNDFRYADAPIGSQESDTDLSQSRAYRVALDLDGDINAVVCVTHESGLEIFLMATAALVGTETGKFLLKRVLETSERRINDWMRRKRPKIAPPEVTDPQPFVERIALRTPNWEITFDGRFTPDERDAVLEYLSTHIPYKDRIESHLSGLNDPALVRKTVSATRQIQQVEPSD